MTSSLTSWHSSLYEESHHKWFLRWTKLPTGASSTGEATSSCLASTGVNTSETMFLRIASGGKRFQAHSAPIQLKIGQLAISRTFRELAAALA